MKTLTLLILSALIAHTSFSQNVFQIPPIDSLNIDSVKRFCFTGKQVSKLYKLSVERDSLGYSSQYWEQMYDKGSEYNLELSERLNLVTKKNRRNKNIAIIVSSLTGLATSILTFK